MGTISRNVGKSGGGWIDEPLRLELYNGSVYFGVPVAALSLELDQPVNSRLICGGWIWGGGGEG
ncbi:UNVERIFIED_CONTAM: hypothetical protein Sradi_2544000 [Sesamum radiatum]|uniref:Uncharacterized protein n=1 Tax=Sesamum radiatum TaxID=300843 RepID=A0AAW2SL88_SESRA